MKKNSWAKKIPFIRKSKDFYSKISYKQINLWPIMANDVYIYYQNPEKVGWMKIAMIFKNLFTLDKFKINGKENKIFASFIMARDDHHTLVEKALEEFPKEELTILDAYDYKKKNPLFKVSYKFPDLILLFKIWDKFRKSNMKKILKDKYYFFITRTYFRYNQIDQFYKIYNKYTPKAYISFCSQAFPEEGIMTLICKKHGIPTFTMQHGVVTEYLEFNPVTILSENLFSDYYLLWGEKSYNVVKKFNNPKNLIIVGNPKYDDLKVKNKKSFNIKTITVFLSVTGFDKSNHDLVKIIDKFAEKIPNTNIRIKIHPFDEISNYDLDFSSKNINFEPKSAKIPDLLLSSDLIITHNTSVSMEALFYKIPILTFKDKNSLVLWRNSDTFKNEKDLENIITKLRKSPIILRKWLILYKKELSKDFYQPKGKSVSKNYHDTIIKLINK